MTRPAFPTRSFLASLATMIVPAALSAQTLTQTLPAGFDTLPGNVASSRPMDTMSDSTWQWHYDASNFTATQEILITQIYVRAASPLAAVGTFSFPQFEVSLIEASTDYRVNSHDPIFANNSRRTEVVRSDAWFGGPVAASGGLTGRWVSLRLVNSFAYDPTTGNDLIVQIRTCAPTRTLGTRIDALIGLPGTLGGNRYGHATSCTATTANTIDNEVVPIVRIDYVPVQTQTLPFGFDNQQGGTGTGLPQNSTASQRWQWHYDSTQFAASGPIAIAEVAVRASLPAATIAAFDFPSFQLSLTEATTDYRVGLHSPTFALNQRRTLVVNSGRWSGGPVTPSGGATSTWVPFQLDRAFVYDRTNGNDFMVEMQQCTAAATWGVLMDGVAGAAGTNGGNRYGHLSDCNGAVANFNNDEFVPIVRVHYVSAVVSRYPYFESFDDVRDDLRTSPPWIWQQDPADQDDWQFLRVATPSTNTGPAADHTTGVPGAGAYAHTEDSNGEFPAVHLDSPYFDLSGLAKPQLSFWLHSNDANGGANENFLHVDAVHYPVGAVTADLIAPIGHVGDVWQQYVVDLSAFAGQTIQVRFRGETDGGSFTHDLAIDDIRIGAAAQGNGQAPRAAATLDINEALTASGLAVLDGRPGPYFAEARLGGDIAMALRGERGQPIFIMLGPLNPALLTFPFGQLDIGPTLTSLMASGFFTTNLHGEARFSFAVPFVAPGTRFGFQTAIGDSSPSGIALSNAVEVVIVF